MALSKYKATIHGIRRLEKEDISAIEKLTSIITKEYFGDVNLAKLIEHSYLSLCAYNASSQVVAAVIFHNSPNVPAIPKWEWLPWIKNLYKLNNLSNRNTLFIHFMAWDSRYKFIFPIHLFTTVFYTFLYVHHIILISPPGAAALVFIEEYFATVLPDGYKDTRKVQTLYLTFRQNFVSRYKIRRAVEEDNDDIVPLIRNHTDRLKEMYGDFYISEIINSQAAEDANNSKRRQIIVAESNEVAIGILCLTTDIAFEELNKCFELRPFHGLRKPDVNDIDVNLKESEEEGEQNPDNWEIHTNQTKLSQVKQEDLFQSEETVNSSISEFQDSLNEFTIFEDVSSFYMSESEKDSEKITASADSYYSFQILTDNNSLRKFKFTKNFKEEIELKKQAITEKSIPKYKGQPNAFAIELFTSCQENERAVATNLIEAAFECYPDKDYCILSVPSTYPPWPLLQSFVRVAPRPYSTYPHELYILHRNALLSELEVREAVPSDLTAAKDLLRGIRKGKQIFTDFSDSILSPKSPFRSYVLTTEKCIVGGMTIREEDEYDYLSSHYILNEYIDLKQYSVGSFGLLVHAFVSPIFQTHKRFFLSEVHRLSDLPIIHFCLYPNEVTDRTLANIVAEMIAVEPRLRPEYHPNEDIDGDVPRDFVLRQDPPYALYIMNLRHSSILKMDVNRKLVVVGASTTGLAFLENIVFGQTASYISFTNITLVSAHGLSYMKPPNRARDLFFPFEGRYDYAYMRKIAIQCYINLVTGIMTAINRKDKYIVVDKHHIIPYDYLFLTCGEQYQVPEQIFNSDSLQEYPENLFVVNTETDADIALSRLRSLIDDSDTYTVIVYGSTLEAYCCLAALLEFGIPGTNITFVEPFPDRDKIDDISLFNDADVDDAVRNGIKAQGITFYTTYYIKSWNYIPKTKKIKSVKFESKFKFLEIDCIALFFYYQKAVSKVTLSAINRAGLVYDSRLVIDPLYQTNDPCIFSAGSMTKYSRRYYADHLSQKYFNHMEVGSRLALYIKRNLDPTFEKLQESPSTIYMREILTPLFQLPVIKYCSLPDGLNYLSITKPGKPVSITALLCKEDYGRVLITGDLKYSDIGYFRLHLNSNNMIETITCLTRGPIDVQNMIKLWGKHEKLLNNLVIRFDSCLINDFFEYFRQPWVYAIFHESFQEKVEYIDKCILYGMTPQYDDSILNKVISLLQSIKWEELTENQRKEIISFYDASSHKKKIQNNLLDFLLFYDMHLPVYAHPLKVKLVLARYEASPLHFPQ